MPNITSFMIEDSGATPIGSPVTVERTFVPNGMVGGLYEFVNSDISQTGAGQLKARAGISRASARRDTDHVFFEIHQPVEKQVDGLWEVDHVNRVFTKFVLDKNSSKDERLDLKALIYNLLGTYLQYFEEDLEGGW